MLGLTRLSRYLPGRLRLPLDEEFNASTQPFEVGTWRYARKRRAAELICRGFRKCCGRLLRPLDAAAGRENLMESQHLTRQTALAWSRQETANPLALGAIGAIQRVREHNGPFPFPEITVDLLAVACNIADKVENIVPELERKPEQIPEAVESTE